VACQLEGFTCLGIDLDAEGRYLDIAIARTAQRTLWEVA